MQRAQRFDEVTKNFLKDETKSLNSKITKASSLEDSVKDSFFGDLKRTAAVVSEAYTDNGALAYATTGSELLDFDFNTASFRQGDVKHIMDAFTKAFYEDKDAAMRYLFYLGDIREGKGERHIFTTILETLAYEKPEIVKAILPLIPEYGRWDEAINLVTTPVCDDVVNLVSEQLKADMIASKNGEALSLCAKWMPSINASNKDTVKKALIFIDKLGVDKKDYRKMLSNLRDNLNVIEKLLAEKNVERLSQMQEKFTSKQNYKYQKALERLMPEERNKFFNDVLEGKAKINTKVLEPYEIFYRYRRDLYSRSKNTSYEIYWKLLPNKIQSGKNVLVVRDGSGSMYTTIPGTNNGEIVDVASALTTYFAQHAEGKLKNKFITFSSHPEIVDISQCNTLAETIQYLYSFGDCSNTNIEKVFNLILETAKRNNYTQEDLPRNILIVSDMQFDAHSFNWNAKLFDAISSTYEAAGYKLPRLIFWNVATHKTAIPKIQNDKGLVLLSGYSKNIFDMICEDNFEIEVVDKNGNKTVKQLTPAEILHNKIYSERYDAVSNVLAPILNPQNYEEER